MSQSKPAVGYVPNLPYTYIQNITIATAGEITFSKRVHHDFYLYDFVGVDSAATGVDVNFVIEDVTSARRFMSEPARAALIGVDVPGKSSWLHPIHIPRGNIIQVRAILRSGASGVDFDFGLRGFHHRGGVPVDCPAPAKDLYFYIWDFGGVAAAGEVVKTNEILRGYDFVALGFIATPNCAPVDTMYFKIRNDSSGREWQDDWMMGSAVFGDISANVRRKRFAEEVRLDSGEAVTMIAKNTTGAPIVDIAVCAYGFHVKHGEEL